VASKTKTDVVVPIFRVTSGRYERISLVPRITYYLTTPAKIFRGIFPGFAKTKHKSEAPRALNVT
jgi:hypothetical protein